MQGGAMLHKSIVCNLSHIGTKMASQMTSTAVYMLVEVLGKSMSEMWGISSIKIILDYFQGDCLVYCNQVPQIEMCQSDLTISLDQDQSPIQV